MMILPMGITSLNINKRKKGNKMGIRNSINTVIECVDQESAKEILMEAMCHGLMRFLVPQPEGQSHNEVTSWRYENWGDAIDLSFESGWIQNNTLFMKLLDGCPGKLQKILESNKLVKSVTLNYQGYDGFNSPEKCGYWIDGDQLHFNRNRY